MKVRYNLLAAVVSVAMAGCAFDESCVSEYPSEIDEGFVPLFNGRDLTGWAGATMMYGVSEDEPGVLQCFPKRKCPKGVRGDLWTTRSFTNFVLRFSFKFTPKTNNGIGIRAPGGDYITSSGMEVQLLEDESTTHFQDKRKIPDYSLNASIYGIAAAKRQSRYKGYLKPVGEWNEGEISAEGSRVRVAMNGVNVVDTDLAEISAKGGTPDGKPHPGIRRKSGHVSICWPLWLLPQPLLLPAAAAALSRCDAGRFL